MPILPEPTKVEFDDDAMWVSLDDGRVIGVPLAWFPLLLQGSKDAREDFFLSPSGIHWETLDEDISVRMILAGQLGSDDFNREAA
jgi:hypothetical protein